MSVPTMMTTPTITHNRIEVTSNGSSRQPVPPSLLSRAAVLPRQLVPPLFL